ncbi:hypothetical protein R1sor_022660 [Riccia sorocarpa]|uniref:Uncharacterized protein n=1 Tax=Riccia sorocarpa TaxID=122646 RepID=A0ABD3GPQ8_9MARC
MVNYTNRVMIALESCMGHEIAWPDRKGRAAIAEHFAALGFPDCVGFVDDTLVKLSQRPRNDGEMYLDRKSNYSLNVHVICDHQNKCTEFVREFVLNWDDNRQSSMMDGQDVPVNIDIIRRVFSLDEGRTAPRSAKHYEDLSNWVPERSKTAKTWFANDVFLSEWRPIIQLINAVLLKKQKPLEVTGAFIYILKNKVGPTNLNENLDWTSYFKEKIREEITACRKQTMAAGKRKIRPTCIDIVILYILRVLGVVDDEQLVHSDSKEGLPEPRAQTVIHIAALRVL